MTTTKKTLTGLAALTVLTLLAGCGGAEQATDDTTTPEPTAAPTVWADMSFDQRKEFMAFEVMPIMEPLFTGYDGEEFADFGCDTCHGEDGQANDFAMPNAGIYTLYATGSQEQVDMVNEMRPMVNFMFQEVVPAMKDLLGAEDFNAETGEGFSCFYCHPNGGEGTPAAPAAEG